MTLFHRVILPVSYQQLRMNNSSARASGAGRVLGLTARLTTQMRRDEPSRESGLSIRLFGGMAIQDARGADLLPRSRKTRAVVAMLALTAPKPVQRAQLTALLWSQRENQQARASLRQAVHELQETLGTSWSRILVAERHSLSMDLRGVSVDALTATGPEASRTELLGLFQDGFLEDLGGLDPSFDDWLSKERRRLIAIARVAGEAFLQVRHQASETISAARALLRIDPTHDEAWRALAQAHIELGDRSAARLALEQWRDALGLPPGQPVPADMAVLMAQIRTGAEQWPPKVQRRMLNVSEPRDGVELPERIEERAGSHARRTSLRLGIREMRVIGGDVDQALSAGLAEEITMALSRFRWISCVSGSSLGAIEGESGDGAARWPDADLDFVLDGTIQRGGDRLRVTSRLLDMRAGGAIVWANRFEHDAFDTLSAQDQIAAAIVAQVDPVLLMREGERAALRNLHSTSARDLVLQAVPAIYRLDRTSFHAAGELLEAALRADPTHTDALAWYAYWHLFLVGQGWASDPEAATNRAALLADSAVAMDPNDARALALAGHVRGFLMKRASEAMVLHERSISLNPNLAIAWCFSGFASTYLGDHDTALARMRQAILLSPSDPHLFFFLAAIIMPHLLRGEYREAADAGRQAIELNPWFSSSFKGYLAVLGHLGCKQEAASVLARLLKLEPEFTVRDAIRRSPMTLPRDIERYAEGLRLSGLPEW
jgi:DNA-binding SARP family transcriptional activator/TolB-like protein